MHGSFSQDADDSALPSSSVSRQRHGITDALVHNGKPNSGRIMIEMRSLNDNELPMRIGHELCDFAIYALATAMRPCDNDKMSIN